MTDIMMAEDSVGSISELNQMLMGNLVAIMREREFVTSPRSWSCVNGGCSLFPSSHRLNKTAL